MASVATGSIAEDCGLLPGDRLVSIDGRPLRDLIDYRLHSASPAITLLFARCDETHEVVVEKDWDEDLGVGFESPLFDRLKTCRNRCTFCFLQGLPRGLRRSLYIKDDDYRLSFLFGNFVTLSNFNESDFDRIQQQRLSPLFVSVHATDRMLRSRLLGVDAPDIMEQLTDLGRRGIDVHAQVVLCPGVNDGAHLARTIGDLESQRATVRSVALVPVGLTRYNRDRGLSRCYRADEARLLIEQIEPLQRRYRKAMGRTFVHLADEFYVSSGLPVPPLGWYDGFPQLENGVGLVRRLLSSWTYWRRRLPARLEQPRRVAWVCGTSASGVLEELAADVNRVGGLQVEVCPVVNEFFGDTVTVSGLLSGVDVSSGMKERSIDRWVLPRVMFGESGNHTLDGMSIEQIRHEASCRVLLASSARDLVEATLSQE